MPSIRTAHLILYSRRQGAKRNDNASRKSRFTRPTGPAYHPCFLQVKQL
jgi:hypothetical protein